MPGRKRAVSLPQDEAIASLSKVLEAVVSERSLSASHAYDISSCFSLREENLSTPGCRTRCPQIEVTVPAVPMVTERSAYCRAACHGPTSSSVHIHEAYISLSRQSE